MKDKILKLINNGLTYKEIQKELGCALSTISYTCRQFKIKSKHACDKLSEEKINEIRKLYDETKSSLKVSKLLGVSKTTVLKYVETKDRNKLTDEELRVNKIKQVISWRKRKKIELVEYKGGMCERCGYNKCIDALDFHHKNPNEKDFTVGGKSFSFERLKREVDKCIMICANCHREIHSEIEINRTRTESH